MKKPLLSLLFLSFCLFIIHACKKDKDENPASSLPDNVSEATVNTSISGRILDESNNPVAGASITAYGKTTVADLNGIFFFNKIDVDSKRCIMQISKSGFYNRSHAILPSANSVNYINVVLMSRPAALMMSASAGATLTTAGGASVTFMPGVISKEDGTPYTGTVNVAIKQLSTDAPNFGDMIPGGDLSGKDSSNDDVMLITYGMLGVELTGSSGETVQLTAGTTATLTMPIAASQLTSAPLTIPLWYFDEAGAIWKEQGVATKVGSNYTGTVSHFSWWNWDISGPMATLKGRVVDSNGDPIPNVIVTANGNSLVFTDQNGEYSSRFPAGRMITVQVISSTNGLNLVSQFESVAALSTGQTYTFPNLVCEAPARIAGTITGCETELLSGTVNICNSLGALVSYQYSLDGTFNLPAQANTTVIVSAATASKTGAKTINTSAIGTITAAGAIQLCDSLIINENEIYINGSGYNNELRFIDTVYSNASSVTGRFKVYFSAVTDPPGGSSTSVIIDIPAADSVPNVYQFSSVGDRSVIFTDPFTYWYTSRNAKSQFSLTLTRVDWVGGRVMGSFNGLLYADSLYAPSSVAPILINGKFNLKRK